MDTSSSNTCSPGDMNTASSVSSAFACDYSFEKKNDKKVHSHSVVLSLETSQTCRPQMCIMVQPWRGGPLQRGRRGGPLPVGSCSLHKALLRRFLDLSAHRHVYAIVTVGLWSLPCLCCP